jgi:CspA family cold shock protein
MSSGVIKFFNRKKGFGFIIVDGTGEEIFFHATGLTGTRLINPGDKVEFELSEGKSGPAAINVNKTGDADEGFNADLKE